MLRQVFLRLLLLWIALFACRSEAWAYLNARALALSGSLAACRGSLEAVHLNPAAAFREASRNQLELVGVSTQVRNNSFSVSDYNRYSGAYLSDADKEYLLGRVPVSGLKLEATAGAQAASLWASPVAITLWSEGVADGSLSRDALELLLEGNASLDTVVLTGTQAESYVTAALGFTYAFPASLMLGGSLISGATLRYVKGLWVEEITESKGELITASNAIDADARLSARTAQGGRGVAADLGFMLDYPGGWTFGFSVTNLLGAVRWDAHPEAYEITFSVDSVSLLNATDDQVQSHDSTYAIPAFSTRLPATLRFGACKSYRSFTWMAQWEQGLSNSTGSNTSPRLSGGAEWQLSSVLPLRAGLSLGGGGGIGLSAGTGLHTGRFYLDAGMGLASVPVWGEAKGFELALNTGFQF